MEDKKVNCYIAVDKNMKQELNRSEFSDKNITVENRFSAVHIPISNKPSEIDLKNKRYLSEPMKKASIYWTYWNCAVAIFSVLLVIGTFQYHSSELCILRLRVAVLSKQLDLVNTKFETLHKTVLSLQDRLDAIASEHARGQRDVSWFDEDSEDESDGLVVNTESTISDISVQNSTIQSNGTLDSLYLSVSTGNETGVEIMLANLTSDLDVEQDMSVNRVKRSNNRGNKKKPGSSRGNNANKKSKNHGATLLHLEGARPEIVIRDSGTGLIAPWHIDTNAAGDFPLSESKYEMKQGKGSVEIVDPGLYYIYAQVFYMTKELTNSFTIRLTREGRSTKPQDLAVCSASGSSDGRTSDVTCFTSVVRFLNATDRISLHQLERDRRLRFKEGYSFLGIVHLNGMKAKKINF